MIDLDEHKKRVAKKGKEHWKFFKKLKSMKPKVLDEKMHQVHEEVFACTDCLQCANCCKTTSPVFTDKEIGKISKYLGLKPSVLTDKYLSVDEDHDYVLKTTPCAFLAEDNSCNIYDVRPRACKEYPHTDQIKQTGILDLTYKNISVCPAVFDIVEKLKKIS